MSSYSIPYIADKADLPADLPTVEEIETATEVFVDSWQGKVVGVGIHFVVKYGPRINLLEGESMLFLARSVSFPVPQVYALFQNPPKTVTYIIMERISGSTLASAWPLMDQASKQAVTLQLRSQIEEMRKLPSPGGYCSVGHRELLADPHLIGSPSNPLFGPFDTESEFNEATIAIYEHERDDSSKHLINYYRRAFEDVFQSHEPCFSHGDLQQKNIMIRHSPAAEEEARWDPNSLEVMIVDWEFAGWYPSYWEYSRAVLAGRWDNDWRDWVDQFLEPFRNEYAWTMLVFCQLNG
jgi:hypothetical protein